MSPSDVSREDLDPVQLAAFVQALGDFPRVRVPLESIWRMFADAFPGRPQGREERQWLLAALQAAVDDGVAMWPSPNGKRWERRMDPPLPLGMDRVAASSVAGRKRSWKEEAWHPRLLWVLDLPRLTEEQHQFMRRVNQGMVEGWFTTPAPLRHRSLQLARNEKALARLMRSSLFGEGRLSLDMLGCVRESTPLAWERVGPSLAMIIFENAGPFHVAFEVLRSMDRPPFGMVGYGGGAGFRRTVRYLASLDTSPERLVYVGDLDRPGLRIADAACRAARDAGLPPLEPATDLHSRMMERAEAFGRPGGWPHKGNLPFETEWADWLAPPVRRLVLPLLEARRRVPEEVLGPDDLRALWS